jgi:predicted Zn-dependent peptidase
MAATAARECGAARVETLPNGLTLVHRQLPTPVAIADVWVDAGASRESPEQSGLAHFLEHMIFKGTERLPPGQFDWRVESQGAIANAATSQDYAHFYLLGGVAQVDDLLADLAELLLHPAFDPTEFERERYVVLEELRQMEDSPDWQAFQALSELLWPNTAYARSVLGTPTALQQLCPTDLGRFHQQLYQPANMTVTVVGGVDWAEACGWLAKRFPSVSLDPPGEPPLIQPNPLPRRRILQHVCTDQAHLLLGWALPGSLTPAELAGFDLLAAILSTGRNSRLVQRLREDTPLVQAVSVHLVPQRQAHLFTLKAILDPEHLSAVEALIQDELLRLIHNPLPMAELERARQQVSHEFIFSRETPAQLAGIYGFYSFLGYLAEADCYPQRIATHRTESLQALAATWLQPDTSSAVIVLPTSSS